jgi:Fe-S-cluster containining protein
MTLTEADVRRLREAGFEGFARLNRDGDLELVSRDGRCVFFDAGCCQVYTLRPEGCQLYPLVLDLAADRVVRDRFCPHRLEFPLSPELVRRLRRSVAVEEAEARRRRWGDDG